MIEDFITYQLAMHYLPNISIRLERLFATIIQACTEKHPVIHHTALTNIVEIIQIIEKPELKSRFIKEFMRIDHFLIKSTNCIPNLPHDFKQEVALKIQLLQQLSGKFGENIHQDGFLQSIRVAQTPNNNDLEINAPQLVYWLAHDTKYRQTNLQHWIQQLHTLYAIVKIYLTFLRSIAIFQQIMLVNGYCHQPITNKATCQLILIKINKSNEIIPKIQLGHHGLSIRLYTGLDFKEIQESENILELAIAKF